MKDPLEDTINAYMSAQKRRARLFKSLIILGLIGVAVAIVVARLLTH